jgi:hypothetical protein
MRRLICGVILASAATVAVAPPAAAAPSRTQKGGDVCVWVPLINMSICVPL